MWQVNCKINDLHSIGLWFVKRPKRCLKFIVDGFSEFLQADYVILPILKGKGKGRLWVLQHCCLEPYCTLTRMSSFIHFQRRCTHQAA